MKRIDKEFLKDSLPDLENQECHAVEMSSVLRLYKSGHIRHEGMVRRGGGRGYFRFCLTKKGLRRVKKLQRMA